MNRILTTCIITLSTLCAGAWAWAGDCSSYNITFGPFYYGKLGIEEHSRGNHTWVDSYAGTCSYSGTGACNVTGWASSVASTAENGVIPALKYHVGKTDTAQGAASANSGGGVSADTQAAVAYESCYSSGCAVSISISGSGNGAGFSVSLPPNAIFSDKQYYKLNCVGKTYSPPQPAPGCPPPGGGGGGRREGPCSPILIDTRGSGFRLTNPRKLCIRFDLSNDGKPGCFSWPVPGSGVGFLVYDRDGDGKIENGAELFGNFTPQPPHSPDGGNGFLALAQFDLPENGGNLDLVIDSRDRVWPKLKLWLDTHCYKAPELPCVSLPYELHTLPSLGIHSLGLVYDLSERVDRYGNQFHFYAQINPRPHELQRPDDELNERRMYDVYLAKR